MPYTNLSDLFKSPSIAHLQECASKGSSLLVESLSPIEKACTIALLQASTKKNILIITGAGVEEARLYNDLPFFTHTPLLELPAWETLPSENIAPSPDIVGERFTTLDALAKTKSASVVLTSLQGALQKVLPKKELEGETLDLVINEAFTFDTLVKDLIHLGYEKKSLVSDKGEFAVRGCIIDIFPITTVEPYRIEFWGEVISSIRTFDPTSQKSTGHVQTLSLTLAKEESSQKKTFVPLFDYFKEPSLIILDDIEALEDRYASLMSVGGNSSYNFLSIEEFFTHVLSYQLVVFSKSPIETLSEVTFTDTSKHKKFYSTASAPHEVSFEMFRRQFSTFRWVHPFASLPSFLQEKCLLDEEPSGDELISALAQAGKSVETIFTAQNDSEITSLKAKLADHSLIPTHLLRGYLSDGFAVADLELLFFPMTALTQRLKVHRRRQRVSYSQTAHDAFDISPGEAIVHYNHGIGKFLGIEKRKNHLGEEQEFFLIEYAEKAKLYVPLTQAHLITKYVGAGAELPRFHVLGASRWKKQRETTEKAILGYAAELLKIYAERELHGGFTFPADSPEILAFDEEFPYVETEDQLKAINAVKSDMCSNKAMDRLICGDVGYGKTEVALRAAFKAAIDGKKQVAVLVPTTVLAVQHYENFIDRMASFGVSCALLSRFQKPREVRDIIEGIKKGSVDVVVGTHKILQDQVVFKDLGLIIIDEEQRFGVKAKEHLKRLKTNVDCLTLTATPIPRTLYMSLVGARDLSVITTPPQDRLPIKTIVTNPDDATIKTALLRELNRDGQVYYIHNRIETIYEAADRLKKLLPKARIVIGHGGMSGDELDVVFHTFKNGGADILVATSIIENGIDIPNANTLIVDDADRFGIADLYQLRGRVGRWNRRAYAYFFIPQKRTLSDIAKKRIDAIAQAGGYGGGLKVAMRDLEMRGAGDILGLEQSGHVADIGFHLYCKLLKRTVESLQGKMPTWTIETKIEIPFDAKIPEYYIDDVMLRMEIYQRFGDAFSAEEVDTVWKEVLDRFGKAPEVALWLYHVSRLRVFAAERGFTLVKLDKVSLSYERKIGEGSQSNRILFATHKIQGPQDFEEKIKTLLAEKCKT